MLQGVIKGLQGHSLLLGVPEGLKEWVGEGLRGRQAFVHIQLQDLVQQVPGCIENA